MCPCWIKVLIYLKKIEIFTILNIIIIIFFIKTKTDSGMTYFFIYC